MRKGAWLLPAACLSAPAMAQTAADFARLTARLDAQDREIAALKARLDATNGPRSASGEPIPLPFAAPPNLDSSSPASTQLAVAPPDRAPRERRPAAPLGTPLPSNAHPPSLDARIAQIEAAQDRAVSVDWSKGTPEFASADGRLTFRPRGRIQLDLGTTQGSRLASRDITATQARSLRLGMEGSVGRHLSYVLEGDFADNDVAIKSAYIAWTTGLLGQQAEFALGNRLNDRGIDGSSGTISVPFLERNVVAQGIIPVRGFFGLGAGARVYGKGWHVGVQVSGDDVSNPGTASDTMTIAARAHWNPIRTDRWLVHLGAWGFHERLASDVTRPTRAVAIGGFFNDNLRVVPGTFADPRRGTGYGVEAGLFHRSLWTYGEYGARTLHSGLGRTTGQNAWALAAGWFLTGETPPYLARGGVWSRPEVRAPFTRGGTGAIELAARYETIDYSDNPTAGRGTATTLGVNWYLNNFTRLQLNGIAWTLDDPISVGGARDRGYTVVGRAQIAF